MVLADAIPEITKTAAGKKLKYQVIIEISDVQPVDKTIIKLNAILQKISKNMTLS
jgi:hypothetical protein